MEQADTIIQIPHFYGSLKGMQNKFDKYARQDAFHRIHQRGMGSLEGEFQRDIKRSPGVEIHGDL